MPLVLANGMISGKNYRHPHNPSFGVDHGSAYKAQVKVVRAKKSILLSIRKTRGKL